jgi:hypothetical protein
MTVMFMIPLSYPRKRVSPKIEQEMEDLGYLPAANSEMT